MTTLMSETVHLGVGIDTARYGHFVSFMNGERELVAPGLSIAESADGYQRLRKQLEKLRRKYVGVHFHVRIDAGGQYATNLEHFLRASDLPLTLSIGEPKRNKDYHRAMSPKRKSDASESQAMARFAVIERPAATPSTPQEIYILREIASRLESQVKTSTQAVNRLHNLLARVFPELANITANVAAGWVLKLLDKYPTPERIARAALASLEKIPHLGSDKAQKVQEAAGRSVSSLHGAVAEQLVRQAVAEVTHAQQGQQALEKMLCEAFEALPESGHLQVATIAGIGQVTAAVLVAKIVSIDRFATPENLVGYFGVFPEEYSSGVDRNGNPRRRSRHMSRKGNDLVRRYLFCAAKSAITHNPAVKALYARLRARGTRGDVALGHCMRKLLHLVFAVWTTNRPFDKDHYPWEHPAEDLAADSQPHDAQQEAAGPRRDVIPASKEVTAAEVSIDGTAEQVNLQQADPKNTEPNNNRQCGTRGSIDYAHLRSQITIEQVLRHMGHFDRLRGGVQRSGPCPLHGPCREKSRSFSVNLEKNVFRCLNPTCAAQGNALDLWVQHCGLPLYEAALALADTFGLEIQPDREEATRNFAPCHQRSFTAGSETKKLGVITPDTT
jgi:transposase